MTLEIYAVGGYGEVGRNMTLIRYNDEAVIVDMGLHIENYIAISEEEEDVRRISVKDLIDADALPHIEEILHLKKIVKAIIPTHAHMDHVGGIPFLARKFDCPILCSPYTKEVIERILSDERIKLTNEIKSINLNSRYSVSDNINVEFISITHSIPHSTVLIIKTPEGKIAYANDYKMDNFPVYGKPPNYTALSSNSGVKALITDSLYVKDEGKSNPEETVRLMLKDLFQNLVDEKELIIVTTFSSHIARLMSIVKEAEILGRKIVFMGRSLDKYVGAAENIGIDMGDVEIIRFQREIRKKIKEIEKNPKKWMIVCTGHQGEPKSVLGKMLSGVYDIKLKDVKIVFSCKVIPTKTTIENRQEMEEELRKRGAHIIKNIHASGHGSEEDIREMLNLLKPELIIPSHSENSKYFKNVFKGHQIKIIGNGDVVRLK